MLNRRVSERGFSLIELMLVIAFAATVMAIAVPVMTDVSDSSKLNAAARELERDLQAARMKSVSANRLLRVRLNCPTAGLYRTVEYVGSPSVDAAWDRAGRLKSALDRSVEVRFARARRACDSCGFRIGALV